MEIPTQVVAVETRIEAVEIHKEVPMITTQIEQVMVDREVPIVSERIVEVEVHREVPVETVKYVEIEKPVERIVYQEGPVQEIIVEKPVEKLVVQEVIKEVEVPVVNTKIEYVDRIVEKHVGTHVQVDNCIKEWEFVDLWNKMHQIPNHGFSDACLTADRFIQLVSDNVCYRRDGEGVVVVVDEHTHHQGFRGGYERNDVHVIGGERNDMHLRGGVERNDVQVINVGGERNDMHIHRGGERNDISPNRGPIRSPTRVIGNR